MKRKSGRRYFERNSNYDVYVLYMPQPFGVLGYSRWLRRYLRDTVQVDSYCTRHLWNDLMIGLGTLILSNELGINQEGIPPKHGTRSSCCPEPTIS